MEKIALMSWSLYRELPNYFFKGWGGDKITVLDLPKIVAEEFGLPAVELCETQFPSRDMAYMEQLKAQLDAHGVQVVDISIDSFSASEPDAAKRKTELEAIRDWFRIAQYLGCPSVRVTTGEGKDELAYQLAAATFRKLKKTVDETGVKIAIENHGGVSHDPHSVLHLIHDIGPDYMRTIPDFGNLDPQIRLEGLRKLLPHADLVHVKMVVFGPEAEQYLKECLDVIRASDFAGYYCIEYSGSGDQREAIRKTLELTRRFLA